MVSIWIAGGEDGLTTVEVVRCGPDGSPCSATQRGHESEMRRYVRALAAQHDLVPLWQDRSWVRSGRRRPLPDRYGVRDRAGSG